MFLLTGSTNYFLLNDTAQVAMHNVSAMLVCNHPVHVFQQVLRLFEAWHLDHVACTLHDSTTDQNIELFNLIFVSLDEFKAQLLLGHLFNRKVWALDYVSRKVSLHYPACNLCIKNIIKQCSFDCILVKAHGIQLAIFQI